MKELTKAEEQIMKLVWQQEKAFIKDVMDQLPQPKPAYNTVATILKILHQKEFVDFKTYGNAYQYFPLVNKDEYYGKFLGKLVNRSFNNSFKQLVSMFSEKNRIDLHEADEIIKMMEELKKQQNG
jgi:BlaI family transcriptional regulator, penicillinase repressor